MTPPDPWGVRRAEKLLVTLTGILSARVVVNPAGDITEVHVLVQAGVTPKQVVRNVESALLAQLGMKVDHRRISVAQTASVEPIDVLERKAVLQEARKRGVLFHKVETLPREKHRAAVAVTLSMSGQELKGEAVVADSAAARALGAARAAIAALDALVPGGTMELQGAQMVDAFAMKFVFVGVLIVGPRGERLLTGTCQVQRTIEEAAVLAVLDATNRWFLQQTEP